MAASEMVERVSKAIREGLHPRLLAEFHMDTDMLARAAFAAMREPTVAMIKIGDDYTHCGGSCGNRAGRDTWRAMMDAALVLE